MDAEKIANFLEFYIQVYEPDAILISQLVPDNIMHSVDYEGQRYLIMSKVAYEMLMEGFYKVYPPETNEPDDNLPKIDTYYSVEIREDEVLVKEILPRIEVIE